MRSSCVCRLHAICRFQARRFEVLFDAVCMLGFVIRMLCVDSACMRMFGYTCVCCVCIYVYAHVKTSVVYRRCCVVFVSSLGSGLFLQLQLVPVELLGFLSICISHQCLECLAHVSLISFYLRSCFSDVPLCRRYSVSLDLLACQ